MSRCVFIVALAASISLAGCSTPKVTDLSTWQACLIQPSLTESPSPNGPLTAGDAVQILYGSWTTPESYATLSMEVPGALPKNKQVFVGGNPDEGDFKVRYQQGDTMQTYDSYTVTGKVTVVEFDAQKALLDVDLTISDPLMDLKEAGTLNLKGRLEMQRVRAVDQCRFRF